MYYWLETWSRIFIKQNALVQLKLMPDIIKRKNEKTCYLFLLKLSNNIENCEIHYKRLVFNWKQIKIKPKTVIKLNPNQKTNNHYNLFDFLWLVESELIIPVSAIVKKKVKSWVMKPKANRPQNFRTVT